MAGESSTMAKMRQHQSKFIILIDCI